MTDKRIIVSGSRAWPDEHTVWLELAVYLNGQCEKGSTLTVVHGDCPTGADHFAHRWVALPMDDYVDVTVVEERHPADWDRYGKAAGPIRNREMVDAGADLVLAFPLPGPWSRSRGTWDCVGAAEAHGIPVQVVKLDFQPRLTFGEVEHAARLIDRAVSDG